MKFSKSVLMCIRWVFCITYSMHMSYMQYRDMCILHVYTCCVCNSMWHYYRRKHYYIRNMCIHAVYTCLVCNSITFNTKYTSLHAVCETCVYCYFVLHAAYTCLVYTCNAKYTWCPCIPCACHTKYTRLCIRMYCVICDTKLAKTLSISCMQRAVFYVYVVFHVSSM